MVWPLEACLVLLGVKMTCENLSSVQYCPLAATWHCGSGIVFQSSGEECVSVYSGEQTATLSYFETVTNNWKLQQIPVPLHVQPNPHI